MRKEAMGYRKVERCDSEGRSKTKGVRSSTFLIFIYQSLEMIQPPCDSHRGSSLMVPGEQFSGNTNSPVDRKLLASLLKTLT